MQTKACLLVVFFVVVCLARAEDFVGAIVKQIETTTTNTVEWTGSNWSRDHLFQLSATLDGPVIVSKWNVSGMPKPSTEDLLAWAAADNGAYRKQKRDESGSPDNGWSNLSRRERFLIRCMYQLAKELHPALTLSQFRSQLRQAWNDTPDEE